MNTPIFEDKHFKSDDPTRAFEVPEGYFENLHANIMSRIETEKIVQEDTTTRRSVGDVLRPYLYIAAMFVGLALLINIIPHIQDNNASSTVATQGVAQPLPADAEITDAEYELFLWEETADDFIASSISENN